MSDPEYSIRIDKFLKMLQPGIDEDNEYYRSLPIGSMFWIPCAGIQTDALNIPTGHVGRIDKYIGNKQFDKGAWVPQDQAQSENPKISITNSHGSCPSCSKIISKHLKK